MIYISNRSFLEGIIHKSMRSSLLNSFDEIYIIDLNGDATINQTRDIFDNDQNVFDIKQGVAISIFIKRDNNITNKKLNYFSSRGTRLSKFNFLNSTELGDIKFSELQPNSKYNFFVEKNFKDSQYENFISLDEIFNIHSSAIATSNDDNLVSLVKSYEYKIPFAYRPFDQRYINYDLKKVKGNRYNHLVKYLIKKELNELFENISLACSKNITTESFSSVLVSKALIERKFCDYSRGPHVFPLYIYSTEGSRTTNFKSAFLTHMTKLIGTFNPEEIFDYIYAILYSPKYREKYNEFLKIDFPRIPFTKDYKLFWRLAELGKRLVDLHLLKSIELKSPNSKFYGQGDDTVGMSKFVDSDEVAEFHDILVGTHWPQSGEKPNFKSQGIILINDKQFFGPVPKEVWNYYIGGYQVLNKWLKDRKGRTLSAEEIKSYCKIATAIHHTILIQKKIDKLYPKVEKSFEKKDYY